MIKKIISCIGEYKKYAVLTPVIIIGEVLMEILIPLVMARILDNGINGSGGIPYILKMGGIMLIMAAFSLLCGTLAGKFAAMAGMGLAKNIRQKLFNKVQDFSFKNVDKFSTASLVTRLTTDVTNTQNAFMMIIRTAVRAPMMMIGATIMAVSINFKLSLVFFIAIPFLGIALYLIASTAHPRFQAMLKKYDAMNASVQENLIGIRVVKSFVREKHENKKFEASADEVRRAQLAAEKIVILNNPIMQLTMYASIIAIVWFGGKMIINGDMETGLLTSFISYVTQILMSLMMISFMFIMCIISRASAVRIAEVLDETPDIEGSGDDSIKPADGSIEFRNVSFSYFDDPDNCALENINLSIRSGETIGIIGGTGSSKTSLVQLIPRLYDTTSGEVIVGGKNVRSYTLENLRQEVAMVLQNNVLFSGTIRENLRWGNPDASDEEIENACRHAQAHDFISSLPDGYDTFLGQGGVNVSGGQKQRLCIARALLKKPKIIILDDSTSAVDTATDSRIRQAFRQQLADTTTIIIAQRISSVSDVDRIIVMDDGKINGTGTHEELLRSNEIYREVYESQQKGSDI
ncbi:MAG: ABC transporter ATP-binding protein [Porcipelethomonas sp.]